jgi:hypothetical protein
MKRIVGIFGEILFNLLVLSSPKANITAEKSPGSHNLSQKGPGNIILATKKRKSQINRSQYF